ncbi:MAG: hypothetical protein S4CHLAM102_03340 [Chlamydiia bacterium]|nr:hypothetical protein [Chlamydiia bacterium]
MNRLSKELLQLQKDCLTAQKSPENERKNLELIEYMMTTPWGAPFVSSCTLLEAASTLDPKGDVESSSLFEILSSINRFTPNHHTQWEELLKAIAEESKNH